ncbi:cell division cycle 20.5, cofactor of APC complex-like, partial [Photinus pyralis]
MMSARVNKERFYDRFIPRRTCVDVEVLNYMLLKDTSTASSTESDTNNESRRFANKAYLKWQKRLFQERLWSYSPIPKKVLTFSQTWKASKKSSPFSNLWSVRARTKPLIGPPITVLDMPNLVGGICQHSTDWGSTGYLASVFAGEVYLWSSQKNDPKRVTNTGGKVGKCIRWNKNGTALAMAYELKGLAIFNSVKNKIVYEETCNCLSACCITAMEWTTSNMLITGCKLGRVVVWDEQLRYETDRFWSHDGMIIE